MKMSAVLCHLNLSKIRPAGAKLFRVDGQTHRQTDSLTDMTKLAVTFWSFLTCLKYNHETVTLETIITAQLVKNFPSCHTPRIFMTVFQVSSHNTLSDPQVFGPHVYTIYLLSTLILSSFLYVYVTKIIFSQVFLPKKNKFIYVK
jgi:hypothetical protein